MPTIAVIVVVVVIAVVAGAAGYFIGYNNRKKPLRLRSAVPRPRLPAW